MPFNKVLRGERIFDQDKAPSRFGMPNILPTCAWRSHRCDQRIGDERKLRRINDPGLILQQSFECLVAQRLKSGAPGQPRLFLGRRRSLADVASVRPAAMREYAVRPITKDDSDARIAANGRPLIGDHRWHDRSLFHRGRGVSCQGRLQGHLPPGGSLAIRPFVRFGLFPCSPVEQVVGAPVENGRRGVQVVRFGEAEL